MKYTAILVLIFLTTALLFSQEGDQDYPELISLGILEDIFYPVKFNHGDHARMVSFGQGCKTCHHYAEDDDYTDCADCHLQDPEEASLEEPTLNGAYHRNCLSCHREWSNERKCETCHLQKRFSFNKRKTLDKTDIFSVKHPHIGSPDVVSFQTPDEGSSMVSFHHKEHIELYRYKCTACHHSENCETCHNYQGPAEVVDKTLEAHHEPCQTCHDTRDEDACGFCHQKGPSKGFTHELTGWPLKSYHKDIICTDCHGNLGPVQALKTECTSCHTNFETGLFDHARTGLKLSEDHLEIDCYECHLDEKYEDPPDCVECHDQDYAFPKDLPGTRIKNK